MNIEIIQYTEVDGIRTVPDSRIKALYEQTVEDGTCESVFCDGTVQSADQFLNAVKYGESVMGLWMQDDKVIGFSWCNRFQNHTAQGHFCAFKRAWGEGTVEAGRMIVRQWLNFKDKNGNYVFDLITGLIPAFNTHAVQYIERCGATIMGEIPNIIWHSKEQKSIPGVSIYFQRGDV